MEALGFAPSEEDVAHMIHIATMGSDAKKIDLPAFCSLMTWKMVFPPIRILGADSRPFFLFTQSKQDPVEEIKKAFELFDDEGKGKITLSDLKRVARELGEKISTHDLKQMITAADRSGTGQVSLEDFLKENGKNCHYIELIFSLFW